MRNLNPLEVRITDVKIEKFNSNDRMSIMPQFMEISIYQSIFETTIRAEMLINDSIGLFTNYPFTGEEIITISYQQMTKVTDGKPDLRELKMIIKGVRDIAVDDRARSLMYIIDLVSPEFLQNTRENVSHAFNDMVEDMAEKVYDKYIAEDTEKKFGKKKPFKKEPSLKVRNLIVPNLRPLQAIQWLAKHAVAKDHENHYLYLFYEDIEGFKFLTIQQLVEDALKDKAALMQNAYKYVSDVELGLANDPNPDADLRFITNIINNKRFSSIEKVVGGYYQNELFEISLLQKSYNSTPTELDPEKPPMYALDKHPLNTKDYIDYVKKKPEHSSEFANRVRYIINNYEDFDEQNRTQPAYRLKFGNANKYLYALNQIDLTITIAANMSIKAGDVIYCKIPESHGFNDVKSDLYITGFFIVTEVKQVLSAGNLAATSLRINKDGYLNRLAEKSLYDVSGATVRGRQ